MIQNFTPQKRHYPLTIIMLVIVGVTALLLLIDEILLLGLNRNYVVFAALLAVAISFIILAFRGYKLYKNLQDFLPGLWSKNLLSTATEYMIADDKGKILITNNNAIIDFCNNHLIRLFPDLFAKEFPLEFVHENKRIKLYKLKDMVNSNSNLKECILITSVPHQEENSYSTSSLSDITKLLKIPAYITDNKGTILEINEALIKYIGEKGKNMLADLSIQPTSDSEIVSLSYQQNRIKDFIKVKIYEDDQEQAFMLLDNESSNNQSLSEHNPIAAFTIDKKTNISHPNSAFYKLFNLEPNIPLKTLNDYLDEVSKNNLINYIETVTHANKTSSFEIKLANKEVIGLLYISCYQEGKYSCHIVDITSYKNMEMNFIHSQKMQAIGQLAGGIAHDFNNLLTAMLGFCDLLLIRHPAGDPSFADIMQIKQNANRAANLVRQLLAISRKQVLQPEILDITTILEEVANLIRRLIGENITLKMNHGKDLKLVKVDHGQLEQVIMNLAVNARDAIGSNKGTLTINTSNVVIKDPESLDKELLSPVANEVIVPGKYVLIEVVDTGSGIPKEIMGKIFEPFFSTKEIGAGTGLGLSTVYGIVKQTGGYLYVKSCEGKGTRFSIYLKAVNDKDSTQAKSVNDLDNESKITQPDLTGDSTILLVEDEAPVRMFSTAALTNKGYKVIEAESGEEALVIMQKQGKDVALIITDVIMPGMNGPSFIADVKKQYPKIKVIFMSGYAEEAFSKTYGVDGSFHFLSKPFTLKQLASKVKEVLAS